MGNAAEHTGHRHHPSHKFSFLRHLAEMSIAMFLGMGIGGALFTGILARQGIVFSAARYPELFVLVMGFNMTLPMVAWMRHRGHGWILWPDDSGDGHRHALPPE